MQLAFEQAAYVIALGIDFDIFARGDVIAWADRHIAEMPEPPHWLLALSTSQKLPPFDAAGVVFGNISTLPPELSCGILLALISDWPTPHATKRLVHLCHAIYGMTREVPGTTWLHKVRRSAKDLHEAVNLHIDGVYPRQTEELHAMFVRFMNTYSLSEFAECLHPVQVPSEIFQQRLESRWMKSVNYD